MWRKTIYAHRLNKVSVSKFKKVTKYENTKLKKAGAYDGWNVLNIIDERNKWNIKADDN